MKKKQGGVVGVRFPPGHPVWDVPERQRPEWVRALVGMALLNQYELLCDAVSRIEARLDALEAIQFKQPEAPSKVVIDPAAFFDI